MSELANVPAPSGKRLCGICNRPLNMYNKDDICQSHSTLFVEQYRAQQKAAAQGNRALISFLKEAHGAGTTVEILAEGKKLDLSPKKRKAATELEKYPEALCLLRVTGSVFRYTLPALLRRVNTAAKRTATVHKKKVSRDVLCYLMVTKLEMSREEVAIMLGYAYVGVVNEAIERVSKQLLEDEDIILAVDLVLDAYTRRYDEEMTA